MKFRSPHLLNRNRSALLVVDIQEKLLPTIEGNERLVSRANLMLDAAKLLSVPVYVSEQYPNGLGATVGDLHIEHAAIVESKKMFSCRECDLILESLQSKSIDTVLICGIEAHVCVLQTAFDLLALGMRVQVAVDAIGSRNLLDLQTAIRRMESHGIVATTAESAVFEWCETASAMEFRQISELVKSSSQS